MRPAILVTAALLLAPVSCAALDWRRWREPEHAWFHLYPGPLRPLSQVAVLCRESAGTDIATIRRAGEARARPARHERWHYPECIEADPGTYALEVNYFSRDTTVEATATITETMESAVPMTAEWVAEAGGVYVLRAVLGSTAPLPDLKPRAARGEDANTQGRWYVRRWDVEIERIPSWDRIARPVQQYREAWRRYEGGS